MLNASLPFRPMRTGAQQGCSVAFEVGEFDVAAKQCQIDDTRNPYSDIVSAENEGKEGIHAHHRRSFHDLTDGRRISVVVVVGSLDFPFAEEITLVIVVETDQPGEHKRLVVTVGPSRSQSWSRLGWNMCT